MFIKKRNLVRIISFSLAAIAVLAGFVFLKQQEIQKNNRLLTAPYRESMASLATSLASIETSLEKGLYATSPYQAMVLAANVWLEAGSAKMSLEQLPVYDLTLNNTSRYLNQVGEYVFYLARKAVAGDEITEEEKTSLESLAETAKNLSLEVQTLQATILEDNLDYQGMQELLKRVEEEQSAETMADGSDGSSSEGSSEMTNPFQKVELAFTEAADLIYDGLYSDHLLKAESAFLKEKEDVGEQVGCERAAFVLDLKTDSVQYVGDVSTEQMPLYAYQDNEGNKYVEITKNGGYLYSYSCDRPVGDLQFSDEEAIQKASEFLEKVGCTSMTPLFTSIDGNVLNIKFGTNKNDVTVYTEKISVGVALDTCEVVFFEAKEYLLNRIPEREFTPEVTLEDAQKVVSDRLTVFESGYAVIASEGGYEIFCYEFKTTTEDGRKIYVYVNAKNCREEKIAILDETDSGTRLM